MNAVARRRNGGGSWVGGGPCLVNAVARRLSGGDSWVGGGPVRYTRESLPLHPPIRRIFSFNQKK